MREPWPWLLLLVLIVAALLGLWWWQSSDDDDADGAATTVAVTTTQAESDDERESEPARVPDVVGQGQVEAGEQVEAEGLKADTYPVRSAEPQGTVVAQKPQGGTEAETGDKVRLNVSLGGGERAPAEIPDVTGPKESDARAAARAAGFTVRTVDRDAPTSEEVGEVILQEPGAGTTAPALTQITLYVGR